MVAYTGFGVGAAGVLVGAITGAITLAKAGDIKDKCGPETCPPSQRDALGAATTLANVSNATFAIGALGVGVGVVALLLSPPRARRAGKALTPIIGPGSMGLQGVF